MIKLVGINKIYRTNEIETVALEDVNLTVNKGEFLSIMGPSGCGKSTLLNIMGLLDTPTGGSIEVAGTRIESMKDKELAAFRNKKLGFVFQSFHLINSLNVLDNVELPLLYRRMSSSERKRLAQDVLAKVGLSHRMRHFPSQLSGGQCQRIGIARALILEPKLIICDEPVSALDVSIQAQVLNLMMDLQQDMGLSYVFISHDLSVVEHIADEVMVMYLGRCVEKGTKEQIFTHPRHPYTQALLSAIPVPERHSKRKKIILQGDLPSPANPPSGCIFHTRCFMAQEICSTQKPELRDIGGGHLCACHFCNGACAQNGTTEEK